MKQRVVCVVIIVLSGFCFFYPGFLPGNCFIDSETMSRTWPWRDSGFNDEEEATRTGITLTDPVVMFYPWFHLGHEFMRNGRIPLWNHYSYCGVPHIANYQSAYLYPLNVPFTFLPFPVAQQMKFMLQILLGGMGMICLLRTLGCSMVPALFGALVFLFNSFSVIWFQFPIMSVVSLLPWLLYLVEVGMSRGGIRPVLLLIPLFAAGLTAGHPESLAHCFLLMSVYALVRLPIMGGKGIRFGIMCVGALSVAIMLAGGQLLPFMEYLAESFRLFQRIEQTESSHIIPVKNIFLIFLPDLFGRGHARWIESAIFPGLAALILVPAAFLRKNRGHRRSQLVAISAVGLVSIGISFGLAGMDTIVERVPGLRFSLNHRILFGFLFSVAVLSSLGLERLRLTSVEHVPWAMLSVTQRGPLIACLAALTSLIAIPLLALTQAGTVINRRLLTEAMIYAELTPFFIIMGLVLTVCVVALLLPGFRRSPGLMILFVIILLADLWRVNGGINTSMAAEKVFPPTRLTRLIESKLGQNRFVALHRTISPNLSILFGLRDIRGYDGMGFREYYQLPGRFPVGDVVKDLTWFVEPTRDVMDLLSVTWLLSPYRLPQWNDPGSPLGDITSEFILDHVWVYERKSALERCHAVRQVVIGDPDTDVPFFASPRLRSVALVYPAHPDDYRIIAPFLSRQEEVDAEMKQNGPVAIRIIELNEFPNRFTARITVGEDAFLVVNNSYARGWKASLNGHPAPLLRTNRHFIGTPVTAGEHRIELRYEPWSFQLGLFLSLLGGAVLMAAIAFYRTSFSIGGITPRPSFIQVVRQHVLTRPHSSGKHKP